MKLVIKKGRTSVFHMLDFLKFKSSYDADIFVTESMFYTDDSCDSGWSKLWGISLGHIHWNNSYRIVYRIVKGQMWIGYYAYIGGVSPQVNKDFKGVLLKGVEIGEKLFFSIKFNEENVVICIISGYNKYEATLPLPTGFNFPITKCYPNIKCPASSDIIFDFS